MSQLPSSLCNALLQIAASPSDTAGLARGVSVVLQTELQCADLCRAIEAFREAARVLGILEESRDGKRVYEAWGKLSRFFLEPLGSLKASFVEFSSSLEPTPTGYETLGHKWERVTPELLALLEEQSDLDRMLQESPVSTHVSFRLRSRVLLLDRRAERVKVALDLIRRDLSDTARRGAALLEEAVSGGRPLTARKAGPSGQAKKPKSAGQGPAPQTRQGGPS